MGIVEFSDAQSIDWLYDSYPPRTSYILNFHMTDVSSPYSSPSIEETNSVETPFGDANLLSIDDFIGTALPPLPPGIPDMETFMETSKHITAPTYRILARGGKILCGYSIQKPSRIPLHKSFKPLQDCAKKIGWGHKNLKQTTWFVENTQRQWDLHQRSPDALPDAFLYTRLRTNSDDPVDWRNIAVSGVYHREDSEKKEAENATKVTRCMSECMMRDPRRRFTFGFTAENQYMRLWYCDRAKILASRAFNFIQEPIYWFRFLLGFLFAEDHALGFDPTITRLSQRDGSAKYDIVVSLANGEHRTYRTITTLGDSGDRHLFGRGTRVWKAIEVRDGEEIGRPVALKDSWVDDHRQREGEIYAIVRKSASTDQERRDLGRILLTVLAEGDVVIANALDEVLCFESELKRRLRESRFAGEAPPRAKSFVHYRIVFKEIGDSLWGATSLCLAYRMLRDASQALQTLHRSGWVHGDVNPGNVLLVKDIVKITDLEYLRRKNEICQHDRVCHPLFVPVEVRWNNYIFIPVNYDSSSDELECSPSPPVVFRYHSLHDLESLWWICVYFLVTKNMHDPSEPDSSFRLRGQRHLASHLFWHPTDRQGFLTDPSCMTAQVQSLHPVVQESYIVLDKIRLAIVMAMYSAEQDLTAIQLDVPRDLYDEISTHLNTIAQQPVLQKLCLRDLS